MVSGRGTTTHHYTFDARTSSLAVRQSGQETVVAASGEGVSEGIWMLTLRLIREVDRGAYVAHEEAAVIPLLQIEISGAGEVAGFAYASGRGAEVQSSAKR